MPKVNVDGFEIEVPADATVFQMCDIAAKESNHD